jgi:amino acid adenylation domain-containing protein
MSRVRRAFDVEVPVRALFESPTPALLARRLESLLRERDGRPAPPLLRVARQGDLPLSFAQQRLWFLDQLEPGSPQYNIPAALSLRGALAVEALAAALTEIVRRHEALRTVFPAHGGAAVQRVMAPAPLARPLVDLSALPHGRRAAVQEELLRQEARRPFVLSTGPLLRAGLIRLGAEEHTAWLNLHHIAGDGWSLGVLLRELEALYAAAVAGRPSPLPELSVQYGDFAVWQRAWLCDEVLQPELAHWRQVLAGSPAVLDLPVDRPRPAVQSLRGATAPAALAPETLREVERAGRRHGATPFMVLLASFGAVLSRSSGQWDVMVGSPIANRNRLETEGLIGFFVNTLPLRLDLSGEPSFGELLGRVREVSLSAYAHQDVPFEKLVEELSPERDLSAAPLFQVLFVLQNGPLTALALPGLECTARGLETGAAKLDLTLTLEEREGGLSGGLEHSLELFDRSTAERLLGHLWTLLEDALSRPRARLSELSLLSAGERRQILEEWNAAGRAVLPRSCLHELVLEQARATPEALAVRSLSGSSSYRDLVSSSGRLARHLRRLGVGPEVPVGVCLERTPELVVALLGVLEAGGFYVPLDPAYPQERLAFMLEDSGAAVVLTTAGVAETLPSFAGRRVLMEALPDDAPASAVGVDPDNLAYVVYTSGSTGRPKGVAIRHAAAAALLAWGAERFGVGELRGVLAATSVCFDLSIYELFLPLACGGSMILARNALELATLGELAGQVTLVNTVPSAMAELLRQGAVPAGVETVNLAGEPLRRDLADGLYALGTVRRVYNLYGPSEDTTYSTEEVVSRSGRVTLGRPLPGRRAYVLDLAGMPVPVGVAGELYLGGAGLARGYLNRPELTAERFVPDPFGEAGERLYRTGDLVHRLADGRLDFLGRIDHQVKVRGFRVELGEIEAALVALAGVSEAVVVAREDTPGDQRLVAYVIGDVAADALRQSLRQKLPDYMVPAAFVALAVLPLTPNGKVDRKALPAPEWQHAAESYLAPRTPVEEVLAGIWAEVLGLERVGAVDHFFHLGGHSLLATRVMSRLHGAFGVEMPLRDLFEAPTLADLAARLEAAIWAGSGRLTPSMVAEPWEEWEV